MVNSKAKGASFEREICKALSLWVSDGKQEDVFWRSAMSGGRSTVAAAKGKRLAAQAGDITCIHPVGAQFIELFFVECKHYASLDLQGLIYGTGKLWKFWDEASWQAKKYYKLPLLIAKENRRATLVCTTTDGMDRLGLTYPMATVDLHMHIFAFESLLNVHPVW